MARVNFEDTIYKDQNYSDLMLHLGCSYRAKGMLVTAFELTQAYWLEFRGIPERKWPKSMDVLIEFRFAEVQERPEGKFIYVFGAKDACRFLEAKSEAGKKGGKSKSPKKTQHLKQSGKSPKPNRSTAEANTEACPNQERNENNLTEASFSISNSISNKNLPSVSSGGTAPEVVGNVELVEAKNPVGLWAHAHKHVYGHSPELLKEDIGKLTKFARGRSEDKLKRFFAAYFTMQKPLYRSLKHPVRLFFADLSLINSAVKTGEDPTAAPAGTDLFALLGVGGGND